MPFTPISQDCPALSGVADGSCLSGERVVHRCMSRYALSSDGLCCISIQMQISQPNVFAPEEEEYMQSLRYGLEYLPLQRN
jgi:hypothetical protein